MQKVPQNPPAKPQGRILWGGRWEAGPPFKDWLFLEEDKRATTNVQNGLVVFFLFSFILFDLKQ